MDLQEELFGLEDEAKNEAEKFAKKWATEKLEAAGFQGMSKDVIALGASWAAGGLVALGFWLLSSFLSEDTEKAIGETLDEIRRQLDNMNDALNQLQAKFDQKERSALRKATQACRDAIGTLLSAMRATPAGKDLDTSFDELKERLEDLDTSLSVYVDKLATRDLYGHLWEPFRHGSYAPLDEWGYLIPGMRRQARWDTYELLYNNHIVGWGLLKRYSGGAAEQVPTNLWENNVIRPDYRASIATLVEALVTALSGHFVYDPALRTTGIHRSRFRTYAAAMRTLAEHILGGIQVARPIQLELDEQNWYWGYGLAGMFNEARGQHYILAGGWPVGAIDTVTGAHIFRFWWKPAEHGFPVFAWANRLKYGPLSGLLDSLFQKASQAANEFAEGAWSTLAVASGAFDLLRLAKQCDEFATAPTASETVRIAEPDWEHEETADGTESLPIAGSEFIEHCLGPKWIADAVRLHQRAIVKVHLQPNRYRWRDGNPSEQREQFIAYRFWLRSGSSTLSGLPVDTPPAGKDVPSVELDKEAGSVTLSVPTFYYLQTKAFYPVVGLTLPEAGPTYQGPPAKPAVPISNFKTSGSEGWAPVVVDPFAGLTGTGIGSGGRWFWGGPQQITLTYKRSDLDGRVEFVFEHDGPENALLWLEVEEFVGNPTKYPPPNSWKNEPATLSSWQRLVFFGRRLDVPWGYFEALDSCLASLVPIVVRVAAASGEPPFPDPQLDRGPAGYFTRVDHLANRITGRSLRELHSELQARALDARGSTELREKALEAKIQTLEAKIQTKDSVIAEICEKFVKTKKERGEL